MESPDAADLYYNLGVSLSRLQRREEAATAYESAAHLGPSNGDAWDGLGQAYYKLGPQDGHAHYVLAGVYLGLDDAKVAFAAIERAAACFAAQREPLHRLLVARCTGIRGAALSMIGRHHDAMVAFNELLRLEPDFFERWPEFAAPYELSRRETKGSS